MDHSFQRPISPHSNNRSTRLQGTKSGLFAVFNSPDPFEVEDMEERYGVSEAAIDMSISRHSHIELLILHTFRHQYFQMSTISIIARFRFGLANPYATRRLSRFSFLIWMVIKSAPQSPLEMPKAPTGVQTHHRPYYVRSQWSPRIPFQSIGNFFRAYPGSVSMMIF